MPFCMLLAVFCIISAPLGAKAANARDGVYLYDEADLISREQAKEVEQYLRAKGDECGYGIYIVTINEGGYGASDRYLEDFYDDGYDRNTIDRDCVLMLLDMEERYVNIQAYGEAEQWISDSTGDDIIDDIYSDLRNGDYYACFKKYADSVVSYVEYWQNYVPVYKRALPQLAVSLVIAAIAVGIMSSTTNSRAMVGAEKYENGAVTGIRAKKDEYIRTSVTKVKKPEPSKSGGGHSSSGGHSHSSAGRHF